MISYLLPTNNPGAIRTLPTDDPRATLDDPRMTHGRPTDDPRATQGLFVCLFDIYLKSITKIYNSFLNLHKEN